MIDTPLIFDGARRATPSLEWLRSPARPALQVASALDRVRRAPSILPAMRSVPDLLAVVDRSTADGVSATDLLEPIVDAIDDTTDTLTAIAAIHALARVQGVAADRQLAELTYAGAPGYEEHALWAIGERKPAPMLVRPLARAVARGGMAGMHAQRALATWAMTDPERMLVALEMTLLEHEATDARRYVTETIGLVPGRPARQSLERIALDVGESDSVRTTAIAGFAERVEERLPSSIAGLGRTGGELSLAARSTVALRRLTRRGPRRADERADGVHVAQIHLGKTGGLATLLPQLGATLASGPRIGSVTSVVRATEDAEAGTTLRAGHRVERIALPSGDGTTFGSGWASLVAVTRALRGAMLAGPLPDVMHLRMADPGSLAGAAVARQFGIPLVFTLAPDPHRPISAAETAGVLDRQVFAAADAHEALWFRTDLVDRLAQSARELVLFPHLGRTEELERLTGLDLADGPPRHTVIAEGIDTKRSDAASSRVTQATRMPPVLSDLQAALSRLPRHRHGLPLIVSAGRLHPIKGMSRLVEAFADSGLASRANLVIIGGDLEDPSSVEAGELARIRRALDEHPGLAERVVLLGQRSTDDVALVLAATRTGWGSLVGSSGAYACASIKEEFGLAIVEALAAGLPVVAPHTGGPATYVKAGVTGILTDTSTPQAVAEAVVQALDLAADPETARRTRETVEARYTLQRMARDLSAVYRVTAGARTLAHDVAPVRGAAA